MKKRILLAGTVLVMSMAMLTGCGSKDSYLNDIQEISDMSGEAGDISSSSDISEMVDTMNDMVKGLDMKTSEGKQIKKDMEEYVELLEDSADLMADLANADEDKVTEISDKMTEISEKLEEDVEKFVDAAEDAGVDDDDVKDLDIDGLF